MSSYIYSRLGVKLIQEHNAVVPSRELLTRQDSEMRQLHVLLASAFLVGCGVCRLHHQGI